MKYLEAQELVKQNQHLLGQKYKGATIEDVVIVPSALEVYDRFIKDYFMNGITLIDNTIYFNNIDDFEVEAFCDITAVKLMGIRIKINIKNIKGAVV